MKKKQSKKIKHENKKLKKSNLFLVIIVALIFIGGFLKTVIVSEDINDYENRTAYKYTKPTIKNITNKEFQDNIELVLSDQIPLSTTMKKKYNEFNSSMNYNIMKTITKNNCENRYITMMPGVTTFDCDDTLVYFPSDLESRKEPVDSRIENINKAIKNNLAKVYVYYIETDSDIDFTTNEKTGVSDYVMKNLNTKNSHVYKINNFEEFSQNFYKTDHHWKLTGSYKGYLELADLMGVKKTIEKGEKKCVETPFVGSKAYASGVGDIYNEEFCIYEFDIPKHTITINGKEEKMYAARKASEIGWIAYGNGYGYDYAEIIFDYNQPKKENILLIGESYDNAILELIGSHYNKTYSIDLRHYEREFDKKFNYNEYVKEHDIDKVVFIGSMFYFSDETFNVGVK